MSYPKSTRGVVTKTLMAVTVDKGVRERLESERGTMPLSTYVNTLLKSAIGV